ncbi:MAG: hypothetical protein RIF46_13800 [Cyclobacteriaceae bacterium]
MKKRDHWELTDEDLETKFQDHSLNAGYFSHEAHIRLAYIHLQKYGPDQAEKNMSEQIKSYALAKGAKDKYNETVTIAAVKTVDHFMRKANSTDFKEFSLEFPRLFTNFKDVLEQHYGFDIFRNPDAKKQFMEPDLAPFS